MGSSLNIPYFHVISENKDWTINPTVYTKDIKLIQNEYRQENKSSSFIADFGFVNGFKSSEVNERKNINHFFAQFKKKFENISGHYDPIQKLHESYTPPLGGVIIFINYFIYLYVMNLNSFFLNFNIIIPSILIILVGLKEDLFSNVIFAFLSGI